MTNLNERTEQALKEYHSARAAKHHSNELVDEMAAALGGQRELLQFINSEVQSALALLEEGLSRGHLLEIDKMLEQAGFTSEQGSE